MIDIYNVSNFFQKRKKAVIVIFLVLLIVLSAIFGYNIWVQKPVNPGETRLEYTSELLANAEIAPETGKEGQFSHYLAVAESYKYDGEYQKAKEFYEKAEQIFPNNEQKQSEVALSSYSVYRELDEIELFEQKVQLGIDTLENEYGENPSMSQLDRLAGLYKEAGQNQKALEYYKTLKQKVLETESDNQEAINNLNQVISELGSSNE